MKKSSTREAEVCYKDVCAKFYNENADALASATLIVVTAVGIAALVRILR